MASFRSVFVVLSLVLLAAPASRAQQAAPVPGQKAQKDIQSLKIPFGYNEDSLSVEYRDSLQKLARCLKAQSGLTLTVSGHADERGSTEFNIALGERRAITVRRYLETLGVPGERMRTLSYGEEKPLSDAHDEAAWATNRRTEFEVKGNFTATAEGAAACFDDPSVAGEDPDEAARRKAAEEEAARLRAAEEEAARRRAEEEARRKAEADKAAQAKADAANSKGGGMVDGWFYKRMFPWLPVWVGPLVMVASLPAFVLSVPFILSMVYLGPSVFSAPVSCQEPVLYNGGSPEVNSGGQPGNWCGSIWSVAQHPAERNLAGPVLGIGIVGTLLTGLVGVLVLGTGVGLFVAALLPGKEEKIPARAPPADATAPAANAAPGENTVKP